jgi:hypothetical protein
LALKASLRVSLLKRLALQRPPVVLESHGGIGALYDAVYGDCERGAVFEINEVKAERLAKQRPTWSVYASDSEEALAGGAAAHLQFDVLDVDPYGNCWETLEAYFASERPHGHLLGIAVNDGLAQSLRLQKAWHLNVMKPAVAEFGNTFVCNNYLNVICEWNLKRLISPHGYEVTHWTGYHCGDKGQMTHFAAVLKR